MIVGTLQGMGAPQGLLSPLLHYFFHSKCFIYNFFFKNFDQGHLAGSVG